MLTGSVRTFYLARRLLQVTAVALPLVVAGVAWWLVNEYVLAPAKPSLESSVDEVVQFIAHEKGLPRLPPESAESFLAEQTERLRLQPHLLEQFLSVHRTLTAEEAQRFNTHVLGVYKPLVLRDVRRYLELAGVERARFVDECIVRYNRGARLWSGVRVNKTQRGDLAVRQSDLLATVLALTTEEERQQSGTFAAALARRIGEVQADDDLRLEFERRIAEPETGR